jgi:hypothetical protein
MEHQSVTAVEWFDEQLQDKMFVQYGYSDGLRKIVIPIDAYMELKKQAKAVEKKQIEIAFSDGQKIPINSQTLPMYSREEYYDDTYGKE